MKNIGEYMERNQNRFGRRGFSGTSPSSTSMANFGNSAMSRGSFMRGLGLAGAGVAAGVMGLSNAARAQTITGTIDDTINGIIADINGENIYDTIAALSDTTDLAALGRYAGENSNVEISIANYFQTQCHLEPGYNSSYYYPFNIRFTKCTAVTFEITPAPNLPVLKTDPVNWQDIDPENRHPYVSLDPATFQPRQPIVGVDYFVKLRAGSVNLQDVKLIYSSSNANINPHNEIDLVVVAPTLTYTGCRLAFQSGAKGFIHRIPNASLTGRPNVTAREGYGFLNEETGDVFPDFALISTTSCLFDQLAQGGYTANIKIVAENVWPWTINNVLGEIHGNSPKVGNEVIVISAHLDGQGTQPGTIHTVPGYDPNLKQPLIYPSADDNASGVGAVMEIARVLSEAYDRGWRPMRTIRFICFNAEESDLLGSQAYLGGIGETERNKIVADIHCDSISGLSLECIVTGNNQQCQYK